MLAVTLGSSRRRATRSGPASSTPLHGPGAFPASVDYFQAKQSNYITAESADQVLLACADRGLCEAIRRSPDGRVSQLVALHANLGKSEVRAFDLAINWSTMTRIGEVKSSLLATYLDRWDRQPYPGGEVY